MKPLFWLFLFAFAIQLNAQPPIKGTASPQTLVMPEIGSSQLKNRWAAMGMSLFIPGSGEKFLGYHHRARALLAADLSLWMGLFFTTQMEANQFSSLHEYASRYAGNSELSRNQALLQTMGDWRSRSGLTGNASNAEPGMDYNLDQLRGGQNVDVYLPNTAAFQWDWGSPDNAESASHFDHYQDMLSNWRSARIASRSIVGGLILNRVISLVDVLVLSRRAQGLYMGSNMGPSGMQLTFNGEF